MFDKSSFRIYKNLNSKQNTSAVNFNNLSSILNYFNKIQKKSKLRGFKQQVRSHSLPIVIGIVISFHNY